MDRGNQLRVLVTGANGFVGRALVEELRRTGVDVRPASRSRPAGDGGVTIDSIGPATDWSGVLQRHSVVAHLAARVHVMQDKPADSLAEFRRINVDGTLNLARQAAASGVRRFIFISSIKVNGESTAPGQPFTADAIPAPQDPYGVSKLEAEVALRTLAAETGMELVVIRPPLVYGPGVKANFLRLMGWLKKGIPLPLGAVDNRRSLVAVDNLVDLITTCLAHPNAANQTFLVSDGEDLSTTELLRRMSAALGVRVRLLPMPPILLQLGAALVGQRAMAQRLCGSLQVDISRTCQVLNWVPPVSVELALARTARHFLRQVQT